MIIQWTKFEKNGKTNSKETANYYMNDLNRITPEKSLDDKEDYLLDQQTSSTYTTSKFNYFNSIREPKEFMNELYISFISSIEHDEESLELFSQMNLSNDMPVSTENNNNSALKDYYLINFNKVIKDRNAFDSLMKYFEANPAIFIENYFDLIVSNGVEMSQSPFAYALVLQSIPFFFPIQIEVFYFKVIQQHFNLFYSTQYGIEVLNQLITNNSFMQNSIIIIDLMELIKLHIIAFVSNMNSLSILKTLLTVNNFYISNTISDAILSNTIAIALNHNGLNRINALITEFPFSNSIVQVLLNNLGIILLHSNGYLIIELLYRLNNPQVALFTSMNIFSNIPYLLNKGFYLSLIERWLPYFDSAVQAKISSMLYVNAFLPHLRKEKCKYKYNRRTVECSSKNVQLCLNRQQLRKHTR